METDYVEVIERTVFFILIIDMKEDNLNSLSWLETSLLTSILRGPQNQNLTSLLLSF